MSERTELVHGRNEKQIYALKKSNADWINGITRNINTRFGSMEKGLGEPTTGIVEITHSEVKVHLLPQQNSGNQLI